MIVLIAGANGLMGGVHALACAGHRVIRAQRTATTSGPGPCVGIDFTRDVTPDVWLPRLRGVDIVINAVSIVRERHDASFVDIHTRARQALFAATARCGVKRVIQISALAPTRPRAEFLHTKNSADDFLLSLRASRRGSAFARLFYGRRKHADALAFGRIIRRPAAR
jgi:nucleoside-diphosphate-sugar epimerase